MIDGELSEFRPEVVTPGQLWEVNSDASLPCPSRSFVMVGEMEGVGDRVKGRPQDVYVSYMRRNGLDNGASFPQRSSSR
jgi:hypothetical protein